LLYRFNHSWNIFKVHIYHYININKLLAKNFLKDELCIKGYRMDKNYLTLNSRGNTLKALKKVGCRESKRYKKCNILHS
jgi:hypothetical protein